MGNIESVDGHSEIKPHIMPLKVPMPDPTELEERFALVLVSIARHHPESRLVRKCFVGSINLARAFY